MDEASLNCYMAERYDDQCHWYDDRAGFYKLWYYRFQTAIITLSALTTLTVGVGVYFADAKWIQIIALGLATAITVAAGLLKVYRFQEQWLDYRSTAETLKKERYLLKARLGEYGTADSPEQLFVSRVENVLSTQHTLWEGRSSQNDDAVQPTGS